MSNDQESDPSGHYDPFSYNHNEIDDRSVCFPFLNHSSNNHPSALLVTQQALQGFDDPSPYMSYTDCLHGSMDYNTLSKAFDMSCSSSEVISQIDDNYPKAAAAAAAAAMGESAGNSEIPSTPNSSISSSSNEAAGDEDSGKSKKKEEKQAKGSEDVGEEADEKSKKVSKTKKKEKRPREPRFAFLTKSEIDHLEDGYRWRKYGQKAVKNSPYPRSYYRCTTQKCTVKKRVERSFQDPSIVITTYEGQHNHHCPATLRGNAAAMLSPSLFSATASVGQTSLHHDFFTQLLPMNHIDHHHHHHHHQHQHQPPNSMLYSNLISSSTSTPHRQQLQLPDFGLLQDLVPSSFAHKQGQ